jgi:hypothetical protein
MIAKGASGRRIWRSNSETFEKKRENRTWAICTFQHMPHGLYLRNQSLSPRCRFGCFEYRIQGALCYNQSIRSLRSAGDSCFLRRASPLTGEDHLCAYYNYYVICDCRCCRWKLQRHSVTQTRLLQANFRLELHPFVLDTSLFLRVVIVQPKPARGGVCAAERIVDLAVTRTVGIKHAA